MSEGFLVLDDRERIVDFNPVRQEIIGESAAVIHGKRLPDHILNKLKQNEDYMEARKSSTEIDLLVGKDTRCYSVHFTPLSNKKPLDCGHVLVFYDITERKRAKDLIKRYAYYDQLTGLPNRLLFSDRAEQALSRAQRYNRKIAIMIIDIDDFKKVNDTYGHSAGDQVLQDISLRFSSAVRRVDAVSRLGGDEFLVLLPELMEEDTTSHIAQRIVQALSLPCNISGKDVNLSSSIGLAVFPDYASSVDQLVKYADWAMYTAKQAGRNGYRRYSADMNSQYTKNTSA
ncbi:MAG: diguanylate cyclase [Dehalococcoidia bacterium]|nr:diguanylate cyclase [Dehalococcoidia bacterium]